MNNPNASNGARPLPIPIEEILNSIPRELHCLRHAQQNTNNAKQPPSIFHKPTQHIKATITPRATTQESLIQPLNSLMIDQRLFSGDIKLPEFHGNPSEFGSFWELFEELVHKQPFSNIRKLSILLSCCKGDAARCLRMIPRTGD
ncbi:hypothetical protein OSTOST_22746, partial [Ostertagia ostertagi]